MKKSLVLLAGAGVFISLAASMPAQADPPSWAPAHGYRAKQATVREYKYVYYPAQQVYYAPATHSWFWLNGGNWQVGVNLPVQFRGYVSSGGVPVALHSSRPYTEHVYVEERYGRPWREKHHHRHGHADRGWDHDRHHGHDRGHDHGRDRHRH